MPYVGQPSTVARLRTSGDRFGEPLRSLARTRVSDHLADNTVAVMAQTG